MFSKADRAMYQLDRMQHTVDRAGNQSQRVSGGGGFKKIVYILIAVVVILYFIFG